MKLFVWSDFRSRHSMDAGFDETSKHNHALVQSACDKDYEIMKSYDHDWVFFLLVKDYEIIGIVSVLC